MGEGNRWLRLLSRHGSQVSFKARVGVGLRVSVFNVCCVLNQRGRAGVLFVLDPVILFLFLLFFVLWFTYAVQQRSEKAKIPPQKSPVESFFLLPDDMRLVLFFVCFFEKMFARTVQDEMALGEWLA